MPYDAQMHVLENQCCFSLQSWGQRRRGCSTSLPSGHFLWITSLATSPQWDIFILNFISCIVSLWVGKKSSFGHQFGTEKQGREEQLSPPGMSLLLCSRFPSQFCFLLKHKMSMCHLHIHVVTLSLERWKLLVSRQWGKKSLVSVANFRELSQSIKVNSELLVVCACMCLKTQTT